MATIGVIPFGSCEYHGPHLPASTDQILATYFATSLAEAETNLCVQIAPAIALGVSEEHIWHSATLSITAETLRRLAVDVCQGMRRASGVKRFLLLNCHGGNRAALEQVCDELFFCADDVEALLVNPISLVAAEFSDSAMPDVHAGLLETSLLLAIAPGQVRMAALEHLDFSSIDPDAVRCRLARGIYWPWSSADPHLSVDGIIGDPRSATTELGGTIAAAARAALLSIVRDFATGSTRKNWCASG